MANPTTGILLNKVTPAAPTGDQNAVFQTDGATPQQSISVYPQRMVGDSGSGGKAGTVPPPGAGDAAAGKFLKADGTWTAPSGGGGSLYFGYGSATASSGQNQITLGSTPVATNAVTVFQNDILVPQSLYSVSGAVVTLASNVFATGASVAVYWVTSNSTPGSITLGTSGLVAPVIRGSGITSNSLTTLTIPLPSGTLAGDLAVITCASASNTNPAPSGWTDLSLPSAFGNWFQFGYYKILTSGDISTGSVSVTFGGSFMNVLAITTLQGATGGVRESEGGGVFSFTFPNVITNTTTSAVASTDLAIYWASSRQSASGLTIAPGSGSATVLQTDVSNTLSTLAYQAMPGGTLSVVNTFATANGCDAAQIIIKALSSSGYPALPGGFSGTITTAKLTTGGANGSMTFINGILTAQTAAT